MQPNLPQHPLKTRPQFVQLPRVVPGQPPQKLFAPVRDMQYHAAPVVGVCFAGQESFTYRAVDKLDRAVVLQPHALGGIRDGHGHPFRRAGHLQQKLVLLRLQSYLEGCAFAEMQEPAELITKVSQGPEKRIRTSGRNGVIHIYIVTRYKYE